MARTTAEFLEGLKRRVIYPANQELLSTDELLSISSDLLQIKITKRMKSAGQNYLLTSQDIPLVANQGGYDIPYRSISNGCEDIKHLLSDGITLRKLTYITVEDVYLYQNNYGNPVSAFFFEGDQVKVLSNPQEGQGYLRIWYHRRLSRLCQVAQAGQVTVINGNDVTVDNVPVNFLPGVLIDFVKSKSPTTILEQDAAITNVAGSTLTFASDTVPSRLVIGDWIAPAGFTPILPIMEEAYDYFEGACGVQILSSIGDYEGAQRLAGDIKDDEKDFITLLEPRIDGEPEKITNYDGLLRQTSFRPMGFYRR